MYVRLGHMHVKHRRQGKRWKGRAVIVRRSIHPCLFADRKDLRFVRRAPILKAPV